MNKNISHKMNLAPLPTAPDKGFLNGRDQALMGIGNRKPYVLTLVLRPINKAVY